MAKEKSRHFTFLLYPDSLPENWQLSLEATNLHIAISPLHDLDVDEISSKEAGKIVYKKPHYHVIYIAKNPVTTDAVRVKIKNLLGERSLNKVQIIKTSVVNTYLYLTHESKDALAKKKHLYNKADIVLLNNFDVSRYDVLDVADKAMYLHMILDLIIENQICNVFQLEKFVKNEGENYGISLSRMRKVIENKTGMLRLYFDGAYQASKKDDVENQVLEILNNLKNLD